MWMACSIGARGSVLQAVQLRPVFRPCHQLKYERARRHTDHSVWFVWREKFSFYRMTRSCDTLFVTRPANVSARTSSTLKLAGFLLLSVPCRWLKALDRTREMNELKLQLSPFERSPGNIALACTVSTLIAAVIEVCRLRPILWRKRRPGLPGRVSLVDEQRARRVLGLLRPRRIGICWRRWLWGYPRWSFQPQRVCFSHGAAVAGGRRRNRNNPRFPRSS